MEKLIIEAGKKSIVPNFKELFRYKDLFWTLSWRDFKVRYAQTTIGLLWAVLQPVVTIAILSIVFGCFVGVETDVPYLLYNVSGTAFEFTFLLYILSKSKMQKKAKLLN